MICGWFVTNGGSNYAPVWASAFVVSANVRSRRSDLIDYGKREKFVSIFDQLEFSDFYQHKNRNESSMHIGMVAETLPPELKLDQPEKPDRHGNNIPSINLTNWMGLNSVVIKHLLSENKELKAKLGDLLVEGEKIKNRLAILENDI